MPKLSATQRYVIQQLQTGKKLSSLYSTHRRFGPDAKEFGGDLEGRTVLISTIKALLNQGLIAERQRHNVSDALEHIEYELNIIDSQDALNVFPSPVDTPLDVDWVLPD